MPELPEVETIRLGLQKYLVGHTIKDIEVRLSKVLTGDPKQIIGTKVIGIRRFGKGLVIDLDNSYSIAIHIKLTGQLIYQGPDIPKNTHLSPVRVGKLPNTFTHIIFQLDKDAILYYTDMRRFGWVKIVKTDEVKNLPFFKELGPEPFKDLTLPVFAKIVKVSKSPIKPLLMDQKKMSGLGNIYANDALYDSKISPMRKAQELSEEEIERLYNSVLKVLKQGVNSGGASELHFVNALGEDGEYQRHFLVYAQQGKPCKRCGTIIKKIRQAGRGTYFCPHCQNKSS